MPKDVRNNRNFHFIFYIPLAIFLLCFIVAPLLPYIMGESLLDLFGSSIKIWTNLFARVFSLIFIHRFINRNCTKEEATIKTIIKRKKVSFFIVAIVILMILSLYFIRVALAVLMKITPSDDDGSTNGCIALSIISTVIFAPLVEELLFRFHGFGFALHYYKRDIKCSQNFFIAHGFIMSTLFFSLVHIILETPQSWTDPDVIVSIIVRALSGFCYGLVYYKTKNIKYTIIMHITNNFTDYFWGKPLLEQMPLLIINPFTIILALLIIFALFIILYSHYKKE